MKIFAIISEYNPFHNGHKLLVEKAYEKGATHIVAIMSGSFLQRGEPALFSKFARTQTALLNGVNLVIELPVIYSNSSANNFALGAVILANSMGCIDNIIFGSECGDIEKLYATVKTMKTLKYQDILKEQLSLGKSFAKACCDAMANISLEYSKILQTANNTLAIEYIRALIETKSTITPETITRQGTMHNSYDIVGNIASASLIREKLSSSDDDVYRLMPINTVDILKKEIELGRISNIKNIENAIMYRLRSMTIDELRALPDVTEGLENRLYKAINTYSTTANIIDAVKTKRYTHARIRRIIMCAFLGITTDTVAKASPYIRVLGFDENGKSVLKLLKDNATLPVITKISDSIKTLSESEKMLLMCDIKSTNLQGLSFDILQPNGEDYYTSHIRI